MMIKEITKSEFEERFPETDTYGFDNSTVYLENGVILLDIEWNGEEYITCIRRYKPIFEWNEETGQGYAIGFERM